MAFVNRLGAQPQLIDSSQVYLPLLIPRQEASPGITGVNSLLAAAGLSAAGAAVGWALKGPAERKNAAKKGTGRKRRR